MSNLILSQATTAVETPATPIATATVGATPATPVQPQAADQGWGSMIIMIGIVFAAMYFFIIRPQKKQADARKSMLEAIKVNDKVLTIGGVIGTVIAVSEDKYVIEVANGVKIEYAKFGIAEVIKNQEVSK